MCRANFLLLLLLIGVGRLAFAGNPRYVAGASYFDPAVKGTPMTWAAGQVSYYTDQGDLSALLPHASANAFVADSFARWTSIPTAAVSATLAGQLAEDVNGTNVTSDGVSVITMPADIQPMATDKPVAIVYDADGAVTDALLGSGAGLAGNCFSNAAFGGVDNFTADGHLAHALVVMNGNCAQSSSDLPELQYRLVRVLGQVLGLGWSQLNLNVITGIPQAPTALDRAGFPVMHFMDSIQCVPMTLCYSNPDQPRMDDRASLSRLYPVTPQNQSAFPGKTVFSDNTARLHGSVYFAGISGQRGQPMQGVNVVARWVDPATNRASGQYAASSVSGFLFRGNAGNAITGFEDASGQRLDRFGSDDVSVEGYFDLAGLEIPNGNSTATYEVSVEALDSNWSQGVGPYAPWQVAPSGSVRSIRVTVNKAGSVQQDIIMNGSAVEAQDAREPESFSAPAAVPDSGQWTGSLSGYGDSDYFWFAGKANRVLSVEVTALDEAGFATPGKARPVIGMWSLSASADMIPGASTPTAFNTTTNGLSRLDAVLSATANYRVGVADERGDGRPDYRYQMRLLYADNVTPGRVSVAGGTVFSISGMGFRSGMNLAIGSASANILATSSDQVIARAPAMSDGVRPLTISDPATGGSATIPDAVIQGAGPNDSLLLLIGSNPPTPAGTEATNPMTVRVVGSDGITPVAGASVVLRASPAASLSACSGASSCTVLSDEAGVVTTRITPSAAGVYAIDALLAPASYSPPKSVQGTLSATSSLNIAAVRSYRYVAEGASTDLPLTVKVVNNGSPVAAQGVAFAITSGNGTLTSASTTTDVNGFARTTLQVRNLASVTQVAACIAPAATPCATIRVIKVALADIRLEPVAGSAQLVTVGQPFQPVVVRAMDSSSAANPVEAAAVTFASVIFRPDLDVFDEPVGETAGGSTSMPVILDSSQVTLGSDSNGNAAIAPSAGRVSGPVEIEVLVTAGASANYLFELESMQAAANAEDEPASNLQASPHPLHAGRTHRRARPSGSPLAK